MAHTTRNPTAGGGGATGNNVHATKLNKPENNRSPTATQRSWRDVLPVHPPAAELFPLAAEQMLFEQAKSAVREPQFLQIVAKPDRRRRSQKRPPKLTRVAFRVSRLMEFCTRRELQNQTGHGIQEWPCVVLKE